MRATDVVRAHVRLAGRVQGVGFRWATAEQARQLGLAGWVRNLDSGTVEGVFEGPRAVVETMVQWCREGPPGAYVRDVQVAWDEPPEGFPDFAIRPTR